MEQVVHPAPLQPAPGEAGTRGLCLRPVQHPSIPPLQSKSPNVLLGWWPGVQSWCFAPSESPCLFNLGTGDSEDLDVLWIHIQNGGHFSWMEESPSPLGQLGDLLLLLVLGTKGMAQPWASNTGQPTLDTFKTQLDRLLGHLMAVLLPRKAGPDDP